MPEVDLVSRAALGIRCLTSMIDEANDGLPWFSLRYHKKPAEAMHYPWGYGDGLGRYSDALPLARIMTGSDLNRDVEESILRQLVATIGEKGLSWVPDKPWNARCVRGAPPFAEIGWCQRGTLMAFITRYLITREREWAQRINRVIDALIEIGRGDEGFIYWPARMYFHDGWLELPEVADPSAPPWARLAQGAECWNGVVTTPASFWYRLTGYEPAADLVRRTVSFIREKTQVFHADGTFEAGIEETTHFHSRSSVALAALRLGLADDESGLVDWALGTYRSGLKMGSDFGFFPERINTVRHCETCCITDMLEMAILLARYRDSRYWADAERFGKNQLVANQIVDTDWLARVPDREEGAPTEYPWCGRGDDLVESRLGGFRISACLNDQVDAENIEYHGIGGCCHGAGVRALYDLWHYAVEETEAEVRVHMHFSRETPSVTVRCMEGERGRIEILSKGSRRIGVRIPEFQSAEDVRAAIGGAAVRLRESGGYLWWDAPRPDQALTLSYENRPRTTGLRLLHEPYRISWLGNRVVGVEPGGTVRPQYDGMVELPAELAYTPPTSPVGAAEIETV